MGPQRGTFFRHISSTYLRLAYRYERASCDVPAKYDKCGLTRGDDNNNMPTIFGNYIDPLDGLLRAVRPNQRARIRRNHPGRAKPIFSEAWMAGF
jgi:hypothetical protein